VVTLDMRLDVGDELVVGLPANGNAAGAIDCLGHDPPFGPDRVYGAGKFKPSSCASPKGRRLRPGGAGLSRRRTDAGAAASAPVPGRLTTIAGDNPNWSARALPAHVPPAKRAFLIPGRKRSFRPGPELRQGLFGSLLLGGLLRLAVADSELLPIDDRCRGEAPVVRRPLDLEHGVVHRLAPSRQCLLELGLVVDVAVQRLVDAAREGLDDRLLDLLEAMFEKQRGQRCFEQGSKDVPVPRPTAELVFGNVDA